MRIRDFGSLFSQDRSEVRLTYIRQLWKRQAGKQRRELHSLRQDYDYLAAAIAPIAPAGKGKGKLTDLLEQLVQTAMQGLTAAQVFLSLLEGQPPVFWVIAYHANCDLREIPFAQKNMAADYAAGQMVYVTMTAGSEEYLPCVPPGCLPAKAYTLLGMPIMVAGELAGVLEIITEPGRLFTSHQLRLAEIYATQAAVAVNMARLEDGLRRKSQEIGLLHAVGRIVANQPSPSILLEQVGKLLGDFLQADICLAFVVQRHSRPPVLRAVHLQQPVSLEAVRLETLAAKAENAILWQDTEQVLVTLPLAWDKTVQVMPLVFRQVIQGAIVFCWDYVRENDRDCQLATTLATIANQTAMGLDREHLYGSIKKIGLTDTLTEIANRRFFDFVLKKELSRVRRYGRPLSLLMVDIDHFKMINDRWGHQAGDQILKAVGRMLKQQFRASDLPARYGGEEFAVILPETAAVTAAAAAEKVRQHIEQQLFLPDTDKIAITISVGVATVEFSEFLDKITEADLLLAADQALYRAKSLGRNRVETGSLKTEEG